MDQEEFEKLSPEEQERIFHHAPFRERGDLLMHSQNPLRLIQSLSQEELYLVTREMDLEERSEVLRYANLPQLFFISDIDCWKKDRLHPKNFLAWLETLMRADEEKLLAWLAEMDYEAVVTGFSHLIQVIKPEWEYPSDELLGDQPYFTLDERYFISVPEENLETIRRAIEILFENRRDRYTVLLEGVLGELEYEVEEEAFQRRSIRLAERGFPDSESAHLIYRPLTEEEFKKYPFKNSDKKDPDSKPILRVLPHYLALWSREKFFLDDVLLLFREEKGDLRQGLEEELAWLSNKVIACDGIRFASEERVRRGIERARRFVNIGLEKLSGCDLLKAKQVLKERWLETIFRYGVAELYGLREQAQKILDHDWQREQKAFLEFLDEPFGPIFHGLLQTVPEYFDLDTQDHPDPLRDFKNGEEVERARHATRQIECIHGFLAKKFSPLLASLHLEIKRGIPSRSLFPVLGNLFASYTLTGEASPRSFPKRSIQDFLKKAFEDTGGRKLLRPQEKEKFLNAFYSPEEKELLRPLWALVFERLEEEWKCFDPALEIDPRFVTMLSLKS